MVIKRRLSVHCIIGHRLIIYLLLTVHSSIGAGDSLALPTSQSAQQSILATGTGVFVTLAMAVAFY